MGPQGGIATLSIPAGSTITSVPQQWVARLKMEHGTHNISVANAMNSVPGTTTVAAPGNVQGGATLSLSSMDSYEDVFKEITKKLYGDESLAEVIDGAGNISQPANIIYEGDGFRVDGSALTAGAGGMTLVTTGPNGLPPGTIVLQRRLHQDEKGIRIYPDL